MKSSANAENEENDNADRRRQDSQPPVNSSISTLWVVSACAVTFIFSISTMFIIITKNVEVFAAGSEVVGQSVVRNDISMIQLLQSVVVFVAVVGIAVVVVWGSGSGIGGGEPRESEAKKPFDCSIGPTIWKFTLLIAKPFPLVRTILTIIPSIADSMIFYTFIFAGNAQKLAGISSAPHRMAQRQPK